MDERKPDFEGWGTRSNLKCADGLTIMDGAFASCDGKVVPLVWAHQHDSPHSVLGHALLKNAKGGVRIKAWLNDTESGQCARTLVHNGDVTALSIYANELKKKANSVVHGVIKEVSLVLAGANPGAYIDCVNLAHSEDWDDGEAYIFTGLGIEIGSEEDIAHEDSKENNDMEDKDKGNKKEKTVADVFDELTDEQKKVVYGLIGTILEEHGITDNKEEEEVKHNAFEQNHKNDDALMHDAIRDFMADAKANNVSSVKQAYLAHAQDYGITDVEYLFPEAKNLNVPPDFIKRDTGWVSDLMSSIHHTPFARIKSMFADITEDDARAKGYLKGTQKKDEFFSLIKRQTEAKMIYKRQRMDRDDIIDITDFDVIAWLKSEMRMMLDEEIARAILVSDGRPAGSDIKISETNIRPIWKDDDLYTIKYKVNIGVNATPSEAAKEFIRSCVKSRKNYKGSGSPTLFTTEDMLTDMLLLEDLNQRIIYETQDKLATACRAKKIVTVPVMEGLTREAGGKTYELMGILVNPVDYNVGADKGGAIRMFDDFDINFNQEIYLIETKISGALIRPYSAIVLEREIA